MKSNFSWALQERDRALQDRKKQKTFFKLAEPHEIKKKNWGPHFTPVRMAATQKSTSNKWREGMEKREPSYTVGGMQTSTATMENSVAIP